MADQKLSALTELAATPADNDEIYIRDEGETPANESKRITVANLKAAGVSDTAYGAGWNGVTTISPSKNAVYDKIEGLSTDSGEGHIVLLPFAYSSIGQGTWGFDLNASYALNHSWQNSSLADGDNYTLRVFLAKGTYTLGVLYLKTPARAIFDIDFDGAEKASFDGYDAGTVFNVWGTQAGISIASSGLVDLKVRVDGRNGSASGWACSISAIVLWRTA